MKDFQVFYDAETDILYLGKKGQEEEVVELSPGLNAELDAAGNVIGFELFNASSSLKQVIHQMNKKLAAA